VRVLVASILAFALTGAASATDKSWTGIYLGAHSGYGWSDLDLSLNAHCPGCFDPDQASPTLSGEGWVLGLHGGGNLQFGKLVLGAEADVSFGDLGSSGLFGTTKYVNTNGTDGTYWSERYDIESFGSVRGRLGYAFDHVMVYGTGGWAWADIRKYHDVGDGNNPPHAESRVSEQLDGYAAGGGAEWMLYSNILVRAEYLYYDFDATTFAHNVGNQNGQPDLVDGDLDMHVVRAGLSIKFGPREEAVVPLK
jgi:outer membrane immunogenic protein